MDESGADADHRRLNALVRPDGSVVIPSRLTPWVRSLLEAALSDVRRAGRGGALGVDVLETLDALRVAEMSDIGRLTSTFGTLEVVGNGDVSGEILTPMQAAQILECTERTVRRALAEGRLPGWKSGARQWLIRSKDLDDFRFGRGNDGQDSEGSD
jgi:excisionase family DNA binding protein